MPGLPDVLRAHTRLGVAVFIGLLMLVAGERRLSEAHFNLRTAATGLENDDALDSDEIRLRLLAVKDEQLPVLPRRGSAFHARATLAPAGVAVDAAPGVPAPRGPPSSSPVSLA